MVLIQKSTLAGKIQKVLQSFYALPNIIHLKYVHVTHVTLLCTSVDSNDVRDNVEALLEKDFRFLEDEDSDDEDEEEWSGGQNMDAQVICSGYM